MTNSERSSRRIDEVSLQFYPGENQREDMIDILADTMHFCYAHDIDFDACLKMARIHFEAEIE